MNNKNPQPNTKNVGAIFLSTLPIFLCFIITSIHTIVTKDSIWAISLSIFSLMIFTSMLTLVTHSYVNYKKQNKQ
ncbi:hypothetical protein [Staphylococcus caeli]|uniref:hypothetical protein n=1 Tax=Staphylococcus caeli TaxID=2201815 RepID=UPI003F572465